LRVIAAKADQHDPIDHYKADVFTQSRNKDDDKIMSASYLERANQVSSLENEGQFSRQIRRGEQGVALPWWKHVAGGPARVRSLQAPRW
jgi:hypothetical protein